MFLALSFPDTPITLLRFTLRKCGEDIVKCTDELLNRALIEEERTLNDIADGGDGVARGTVDDFFATELNVEGDATPFGATRGISSKDISRRRKRERKVQKGVGLPKHHHVLDPALRTIADGSVTGSAAGSGTSKWAQMGAEVDWMVKVLGLPKSTVQSAFHAHASSLPATLNALLEAHPWSNPATLPTIDHKINHESEENENVGNDEPNDVYDDDKADKDVREEAYKKMIRAYPSLGANRINDILNATKNQLGPATEVASVLMAWRPTIGSLTTSLSKSSLSSPAKNSNVPANKTGSLLFDPIRQHGGGVTSASRHTITTPTTSVSAVECRELVAEYSARRNQAFKQAASAHQTSRSKNNLVGGAAMYYAQLGRDYDAKMREYSMLAAQASASENKGTEVNGDGVRVALDVHGCTVHQALTLLKADLTAWYAHTRASEHRDGRVFSVITGLGHHSAGGEARILPAVQKWLSREGWRYTTIGGQVLVKGLERD